MNYIFKFILFLVLSLCIQKGFSQSDTLTFNAINTTTTSLQFEVKKNGKLLAEHIIPTDSVKGKESTCQKYMSVFRPKNSNYYYISTVVNSTEDYYYEMRLLKINARGKLKRNTLLSYGKYYNHQFPKFLKEGNDFVELIICEGGLRSLYKWKSYKISKNDVAENYIDFKKCDMTIYSLLNSNKSIAIGSYSGGIKGRNQLVMFSTIRSIYETKGLTFNQARHVGGKYKCFQVGNELWVAMSGGLASDGMRNLGTWITVFDISETLPVIKWELHTNDLYFPDIKDFDVVKKKFILYSSWWSNPKYFEKFMNKIKGKDINKYIHISMKKVEVECSTNLKKSQEYSTDIVFYQKDMF